MVPDRDQRGYRVVVLAKLRLHRRLVHDVLLRVDMAPELFDSPLTLRLPHETLIVSSQRLHSKRRDEPESVVDDGSSIQVKLIVACVEDVEVTSVDESLALVDGLLHFVYQVLGAVVELLLSRFLVLVYWESRDLDKLLIELVWLIHRVVVVYFYPVISHLVDRVC